MCVAPVGVWPVSRAWAFNASLGVATWGMDYTHRVETLADAASAILLGIGVSYGLT